VGSPRDSYHPYVVIDLFLAHAVKVKSGIERGQRVIGSNGIRSAGMAAV
jgi:hypothetical protein